MVGASMFLFKGKNKVDKALDIQKPEPFDKKQRINLYLIVIMVVIVLVPPVLNIISPKNASIAFINSKVDIGLVAIIFAVIASAFHLADEKKVIAKVPWTTLILVSGVGILISVAVKAGTLKLLAGWVSGNIPTLLIPIAVSAIGTIMCFFASLIGVVIPALFPIIPGIAHATGINPVLLYTCVVIGAQAATLSPFSTGGAMVMGYGENDEERKELFNKELFRALPACTAAALIMTIVISIIIK
jgi:di/tricarboxylate transporter